MRKWLAVAWALMLIGIVCVMQDAKAQNKLLLLYVGGSSGCSQATSFLGRATNVTGGSDITNYTNLICGLVTDGVTSSLDALYIFAAPDSTTALLNLVSSSFTATNNSTTFTAYKGFINPSVSTIDTGFNPTTATSPNYTQNSAHMAVWNNTNGNSANATFGSSSAGENFFSQFTDGDIYTRINDNPERSGFNLANPHGLGVGTREGATVGTTYFGLAGGGSISSQGTTTNASQAPLNTNFKVFPGADITHQIAMVSFGGSLTSGQVTSLYNRVQTYMTAVGN